MGPRAEPFLAPDERSYERALEEKREHTFHRQGLANDRPGIPRETGPVSPELELHRDSGDYSDCKIQTKDSSPESCCSIVLFISGPECAPFPVNQEPSKSHGELRE